MSKTETPDIVSLLRERGEWKDGGKVWEQDALCAVAAAEIERLRSELAKQGEIWRKTLHVERECSLNETRLKDQFRSRALATEAELAKHQWRTIVDAATDDFDAPEDIDLLLGWFDGPAWRIEIGTAWSSYDGWQTTATHWQPLPSPPGENDG